jgi:hypothetical protein
MSKQECYTIQNGAFQELLMLIGKIVHGKLVRQIEYLKVENQILRKKVGKRVSVTEGEKEGLLNLPFPWEAISGRLFLL